MLKVRIVGGGGHKKVANMEAKVAVRVDRILQLQVAVALEAEWGNMKKEKFYEMNYVAQVHMLYDLQNEGRRTPGLRGTYVRLRSMGRQ